MLRFIHELDNLILSHADRTRIVDEEHGSALISKNLDVAGTFLVDGWHLEAGDNQKVEWS